MDLTGRLNNLSQVPQQSYSTDAGIEKQAQTVKALKTDFTHYIRDLRSDKDDIDSIVRDLSIKEINTLLFEKRKNLGNRHFADVIEDFLSSPDAYDAEIGCICDGYCSSIHLLQERVSNILEKGITREDSDDNRTSTANYLDWRLTSIFERTKLVIFVHKSNEKQQQKIENKVAEIEKTTERNLQEKSKDELESFGEKIKKESQERLSDLQSKIENKVDSILPNLITMMGVFATVIVVVLSLIATSSAWIASANDSEILIAFFVPAGIAVLVACALTAFIRSMLFFPSQSESVENTVDSGNNKCCGCVKRWIKNWGVWLFVATATSAIIFGVICFCGKSSRTHYIVRYIPMSISSAGVCGSTDDNSGDIDQTDSISPSDNFEPELFIKQEIIAPDGRSEIEMIPCSADDVWEDGYVYYCLLHQCIEH